MVNGQRRAEWQRNGTASVRTGNLFLIDIGPLRQELRDQVFFPVVGFYVHPNLGKASPTDSYATLKQNAAWRPVRVALSL